uniref:Uncharacterized protein n=1 Tax=Avena sativa TaxID=4498 RepID=A0ACD5WBR2_AVESA
MARVPDLGSDFAQKLLLDLRRRRERLGFGSAAAAQQQQQQQRTTSSAAAATRDARSGSQKPLRSQKPQQAAPAPRARAPEAKAAPTRSSQQQPGNAIPTAGKPRRRRDVAPVAAADARAIVPYQGGGGGGAGGGGGKPKHVVASNVDVQRMAALALALSDGGKLRNIKIMARDGSVFLRAPDTPAHRRGGGAGAVAIGVQDLNDMLMAAYSSGVHSGRRRSDGAGEKRLFRGSMDMEEALSMLVMLQDASGYVEGSGSGKVLLLKDKENRESSATTTRGSARIVEIVDEESETEEASKNASMQIVVHDKFVQSHDQSPNSSSVMQSGPTDSKTSNGSQGEKDGSKVRMPSVIAKLMGLENLPSSAAAKTVVERKGTERFVKSESVPRMEIRANAMDRKLPIRIVASEKVLSKGQDNILLPGEWKSSSLTDFGEPELPNSPSCPATGNKHVRLTMRDVLRKMVGSERGDDGSQGVDERIIHEDKTFTEEIKLQKPVSVGCRSSDSGKKMDFLKRFRKNSDNKPAIQEKHTTEGKSTSAGKKQATGMKRLLGRDSEAKSRREREKLNKENQATAQTKVAAAGKNGKADQMKRQSQQSKHMDRQTTPRKARNCRETQRETPSRNLEDKKALTLKAAYVKKKPGYAVVIQPEDEEHAEVSDISSSKPSGSGNFPEELAIVVRGSSTAGGEASSYKTLQKTTEATSDLTISVQSVVRESEDSKFLDQTATSEIHVRDNNRTGAASSDQPLQEVTNEASVQTVAQESESLQLLDQSPIAEINAQAAVHASEELKFMNQSATSETYDGRINHTATETTRIPETFAEEEHQQQTEQHQHQQQQMTVKEQPTDGPDQTTTSTDSTGSQEQATHVVSCDSFTENQLLLVRMLVKDRYLLETAKAIVRVHDPVSFVDDDDAGARSRPDKGNSDLLPDVAREVIRRKGKRSEAMEGVSVARAANPKLRCLDDLVRELDGVVESLDISKKLHRQSDSGAAEGLQMILRSDIQNDHPDANSTWDFGWNRVWGLPIEKNEVVRDLEKNILGGIITDVARDLIGVAVRHGCCGCVA